MGVELPVLPVKQELPDVSFWQECRKRAAVSNIPAWKIAEEGFLHPTGCPSARIDKPRNYR